MGLTNLFPRNRYNDLVEARGPSTGHIKLESSKPTDEITGLKTKKFSTVKPLQGTQLNSMKKMKVSKT